MVELFFIFQFVNLGLNFVGFICILIHHHPPFARMSSCNGEDCFFFFSTFLGISTLWGSLGIYILYLQNNFILTLILDLSLFIP